MQHLPRIRSWSRFARPYLLGLGLALLGIAAAAGRPAFLAFESEALDLDAGATVERDPSAGFGSAAPGADLYVAYHAGWTPGAVVMPLPGARTRILHGTAYADVTTADVDTTRFPERPEDVPFEPGDTALVRTDTGGVYKLGNARESETGVTFDYARLR